MEASSQQEGSPPAADLEEQLLPQGAEVFYVHGWDTGVHQAEQAPSADPGQGQENGDHRSQTTWPMTTSIMVAGMALSTLIISHYPASTAALTPDMVMLQRCWELALFQCPRLLHDWAGQVPNIP